MTTELPQAPFINPPPADLGRLQARARALLDVFLCSGIPTQLLIAKVLALAGIRPLLRGGQLNSTWVFLLAMGDTALLVLLATLLLRANGESPRETFLGRRRPLGEALLGIALVGPLLLVVGIVLLATRHAWPSLHNVADNPFTGLLRSPKEAVMFACVAVLGGGVREEIQRAFILTRFERDLGGPIVGLVFSSIAFGAGHAALQGWDAAVATGLLGAVWGALYFWRRSAVAPMVSHAGFNSLEIIQYLVVGVRGV
ncbi:MAG TPA: CPBP family intramembrane glutamic endopeptidase [Chloroflexota bacterium]|nr:CPBP family intramembrane glutamic endopeptidase [Chloroflexota bacterium]